MSALGGLNKTPNGVVIGVVSKPTRRYGERLDRAAE